MLLLILGSSKNECIVCKLFYIKMFNSQTNISIVSITIIVRSAVWEPDCDKV